MTRTAKTLYCTLKNNRQLGVHSSNSLLLGAPPLSQRALLQAPHLNSGFNSYYSPALARWLVVNILLLH
jgi:hypothetical protein